MGQNSRFLPTFSASQRGIGQGFVVPWAQPEGRHSLALALAVARARSSGQAQSSGQRNGTAAAECVNDGSIVHSSPSVTCLCTVRAQCARKTEKRGRCGFSKCFAIREEVGGRGRDRTGDPLLAKQVLSQLSYTPTAGTTFDSKVFAVARKLRKPTFGNVDIISAGAIAQATLYALARAPHCEMSGRIFDNDVTGPSNLNRNMLSLVEDVGLQKVVTAARRCSRGIRVEGICERFPGRISGVGKLASRVVVGVDDIPSRWEVQRKAARWLAVAGTSHFSVSSSVHGPNEPCCGCLHPVDELHRGAVTPIPTVSFVSFWAGLVTAVRLIREAVGLQLPPNRQHLWLTPLRMDLPSAALWMPVAPREDCPVGCRRAQGR